MDNFTIDMKLATEWEEYLCDLFDYNEDEVIEHYYNKELYEEFINQL